MECKFCNEFKNSKFATRVKDNKYIKAIHGKLEPYLNNTMYFYVSLLLCFCVEWIIFVIMTGVQTSNVLFDLLHCLGDMMIVMLPFWFVGRRMRYVSVVLIWLFSILLLCNLWYFRFWGDALSPISISMIGNLNHEVTDSISMLFRFTDLQFLVCPLIATACIYLFRPINVRYSWRFRLIAVLVAMLVFLFGRLFDASSADTWAGDYLEKDTGRAPQLRHEVIHMKKGIILYTIHSIDNFDYWLNFKHELSGKQKDSIARFMEEVPIADDSAFDANADKNLVVVIVESMNSSIINDTVNGVTITPNLNRMLTEPGAIYSTNVVTQIREGGSGDGQMMIETGLLPLRKGSASILVGQSNKFPSLPVKFPDYKHWAVFASGANVWREGDTHTNYGYEVINRYDYPEEYEQLGADGGMFNQSLKLISEFVDADSIGDSGRFLMTLLTASMHVPFVDKAAEEVEEWSDLPEELRKYYTVCHYFDEQFGLFIEKMKEMGLYDNTVFVVASDHCQTITTDEMFEPAFFGAFNTGVTYQVPGYMGQVNAYPTILHIMHRMPESTDIYHGLAPSVLDPNYTSAVDGRGRPMCQEFDTHQIEAFQISDHIMRGDYFAL